MNKAIIVFLAFLLFISCKKEVVESKFTMQDKIENAKTWYNQRVGYSESYLWSDAGDSIPLIQKPLWSDAQMIELTAHSEVVILPVKTNMYDVIGRKGNLTLIISNKGGVIQSRLLNLINSQQDKIGLKPIELYKLAFSESENDVKTNRMQTVVTINDELIVQKQLKGAPKISDKLPKDPIPENSTNSISECHEWFLTTTYYESGIIVDVISISLGIICEGDVTMPMFNPDGGGGGANNNLQREISLDTSIVNNPIINCLIQSLFGFNGKSKNPELETLLNAFIGKGFNLDFKIGNTIDPNSKGEAGPNPYNPTNFSIVLNRNKINTESQMSWVKTLLHEAFHANLMQKSYEIFGKATVEMWPKSPETMTLAELSDYMEMKAFDSGNPILFSQHHEYMAESFEVIRDGLRSFSAANNPPGIHNTFDDYHFSGLAYEGLHDTTYYLNKVAKNPDGTVKMVDFFGTMVPLNSVYITQSNNFKNDSIISCN